MDSHCRRCGTAFPSNWIGRPREYCSRRCQRAALKETEGRAELLSVCGHCSEPIKQPKTGRTRYYCSDSCRKAWNLANGKRVQHLVQQFRRTADSAAKLHNACAMGEARMNRAQIQEARKAVVALLELLEQVDRRNADLDVFQAMVRLTDEWGAVPGYMDR